MSPLVACVVLPALGGWSPSADEVLAALARNSAMRHQAVYSGVRQYSIRNTRFGKSASVTVRIAAQPQEGKHFTIINRSGCNRLIDVVESLIASEAEASRPNNARGHEIGPSNYEARLTGSETIAGRDCWVLSLRAKKKSKYLIDGTAWVDKTTHGLVRLEGTPASSVSFWVGTPHIIENFAPVGGIWLPVRTESKSRSTWLGESELEIRYMNYDVTSPVEIVSERPIGHAQR